MRCLFLLSALACQSGEIDVDNGENDENDEDDPRRDPSTWPTTLGGDRPARVVTPETYDGTADLPVIVVLHGYGASGLIQDTYFGISARVDSHNFIAIVPDGTTDASGRRFWNATVACCDFGASNVDDAGYLLGLLDEAEATLPVDPDRLTFIGHSNGGFMAHRLACDAPDRVGGIVSLAGATFDDPDQCEASTSTNVLQVHGTLDSTIRYEGGDIGEPYPSALQSVAGWAARADCAEPADQGDDDFDRAVAGDETERLAWTGCAEDRQIGLWTMRGSSHIPSLNNTFREATVDWLLSVRQ